MKSLSFRALLQPYFTINQKYVITESSNIPWGIIRLIQIFTKKNEHTRKVFGDLLEKLIEKNSRCSKEVEMAKEKRMVL